MIWSRLFAVHVASQLAINKQDILLTREKACLYTVHYHSSKSFCIYIHYFAFSTLKFYSTNSPSPKLLIANKSGQ